MAARRTITSALTVVAVGLSLLAGCTPTTAPTPLPQPSPTCTPEAGGAPYTCTPYQYDQMVAKDKLYAEAEAVYRKFFAEEERIYRAGGVSEATPVLLETTTDNFLAASLALYRDLRRYHATAVGGTFSIAWIKRAPATAAGGSVVALQTCTDASTVEMGLDGHPPTPGGRTVDTVYFRRDNAVLKLSAFSSTEVNQC